jgi:hypothetical protein
MESVEIKDKAYGCGSAAGKGFDDGTGEGSGESDGHGRNYSRDLAEYEIPETGYGRGNKFGGGGGGDDHGIPFNADLESDRTTTREDYYEGHGYGYGYGHGLDNRYCDHRGTVGECGGEGYVSSRVYKIKRRYNLGNPSGSGTEDGRGASYPPTMPYDLYREIFQEKDSFLTWLRKILGGRW